MIHVRPGQPLSAAELNRLGRVAAMSRPGRIEGMGGTGIGSGMTAGVGGAFPQPDVERFYLVKITGSDASGHLFQEQYSATGDSTYTDDPSGINSDAGWRVIVPSGGALSDGEFALVRKSRTNPALYEVVATGGGGGLTIVVPMAKVVVAPPTTGCGDLDTDIRQCWGPYYIGRWWTWRSDCGGRVLGGCCYITEIRGIGLILNEPYPAWVLGTPPAEVEGEPLPVGFPCDTEDMEGASLYGVSAGDVTRLIDVGVAVTPAVCSSGAAAYIKVYHGQVLTPWNDCTGYAVAETCYVAGANECELFPGQYTGTFSRMVPGDEFVAGGDPRQCVPLYIVRREPNQKIDLICEGGDLNLYEPDPLSPCGDDMVFAKTVACCDETCSGGGGGGGGSASCCSRTLNSTLVATAVGQGVFNIRWDGSTYWQGSARLLCGETLHIRQGLDCSIEYSCTGAPGSWVPATVAPGSHTCSPKFISLDWTINMDDTGTPGCITGKCGPTITLFVQEP